MCREGKYQMICQQIEIINKKKQNRNFRAKSTIIEQKKRIKKKKNEQSYGTLSRILT